MPAPYSPRAVANTLIEMLRASGIGNVSQMKLQKLVYYAHAWNLAINEKPMVLGGVCAWKYGPVVSELYHVFKTYGDSEIDDFAKDIEYDTASASVSFVVPKVPATDVDEIHILNQVIRIYGRLNPIQLSNLTHEKGEPWEQVITAKGGVGYNLQIPDDLIKHIFNNKLLAAKV